MPEYARAGVSQAWLVDPLLETLEVFRLEAGKWLWIATHKNDARVCVEPFDALELELEPLWRRAK